MIPTHYNIGMDACDKWADGSGRTALIYQTAQGQEQHHSFDQFKDWSDRFAQALRAQGINKGDRVGILLPQSPETAIAHLAIYKLGAIAVPLFTLFGTEALQFRLGNSGAKALITHDEGMSKLAEIRDGLPALQTVFNIEAQADDTVQRSFWAAQIGRASRRERVCQYV